jgi:CDGSH-type Zn-finger protein
VPGGGAGQGQSVQPSPPPEPQPTRWDDDLPDDTTADPTGGATITPYRDGPLIVRGDFRLVDQDGVEFDPGRRTIALCRCGKSAIKPFCDGTHKRGGFTAPSGPAEPRPAARIRPRPPAGD